METRCVSYSIRLIVTSVSRSPSSHGPLLNDRGEVVGLLPSGRVNKQGPLAKSAGIVLDREFSVR